MWQTIGLYGRYLVLSGLALAVSCQAATQDQPHSLNLPAQFHATYGFSDRSNLPRISLGMGIDAKTQTFLDSPYQSYTPFIDHTPVLLSSVGGGDYSDPDAILTNLPQDSFLQNGDQIAITYGIDQNALDFINGLSFTDNTMTDFIFAVGPVGDQTDLLDGQMSLSAAELYQSSDRSDFYSQYGSRYVKAITKAYCAFFIMHLTVSPNSTYPFSIVSASFNRLQDAGFGHSLSSNYTQADADSDWSILRSDGNTMQCFAFSNVRLGDISSVRSPNDFLHYYDQLYLAVSNGTIAAMTPVMKVTTSVY